MHLSQLRFPDASLWDVYLLPEPTFSSPLAGASDTALKASLPGDLSGVSLVPLADSTHHATDSPVDVPAPASPDLHGSSDSDVPLADIIKVAAPTVVAVAHEGEGATPPLKERAGSSQTTVSPRFSSFLRQEVASGGAEAVSSKNKHGELVC